MKKENAIKKVKGLGLISRGILKCIGIILPAVITVGGITTAITCGLINDKTSKQADAIVNDYQSTELFISQYNEDKNIIEEQYNNEEILFSEMTDKLEYLNSTDYAKETLLKSETKEAQNYSGIVKYSNANQYASIAGYSTFAFGLWGSVIYYGAYGLAGYGPAKIAKSAKNDFKEAVENIK